MSGTERHACPLEVRTCMYVHLRQLWAFITRENASLARLTKKMVPTTGRASSFLKNFVFENSNLNPN